MDQLVSILLAQGRTPRGLPKYQLPIWARRLRLFAGGRRWCLTVMRCAKTCWLISPSVRCSVCCPIEPRQDSLLPNRSLVLHRELDTGTRREKYSQNLRHTADILRRKPIFVSPCVPWAVSARREVGTVAQHYPGSGFHRRSWPRWVLLLGYYHHFSRWRPSKHRLVSDVPPGSSGRGTPALTAGLYFCHNWPAYRQFHCLVSQRVRGSIGPLVRRPILAASLTWSWTRLRLWDSVHSVLLAAPGSHRRWPHLLTVSSHASSSICSHTHRTLSSRSRNCRLVYPLSHSFALSASYPANLLEWI